MPIVFDCPCGKALRVADAHAGRRVKCPACNTLGTVPEPEPDFEIVEDPAESLAPAPGKGRPIAKPATSRDDDDDDGYRVAKAARDDDDDDDDRGRKKPDFRRGSGRNDDDDDEEDRPRKKKRKKKRRPAADSSSDSSGTSASVGGGLLMMIGAIVWFVLGLMFDWVFFYPPIMFVLGLIAFIKGMTGQE